jgi:hypothetical protein
MAMHQQLRSAAAAARRLCRATPPWAIDAKLVRRARMPQQASAPPVPRSPWVAAMGGEAAVATALCALVLGSEQRPCRCSGSTAGGAAGSPSPSGSGTDTGGGIGDGSGPTGRLLSCVCFVLPPFLMGAAFTTCVVVRDCLVHSCSVPLGPRLGLASIFI